MKKWGSWLAVLLVIVLFTAACGGNNGNNNDGNATNGGNNTGGDSVQGGQAKEVTFWYYFGGNEEQELLALIDQYNASQNKYRVNGQYIPFGDMKKRLLRRSEAGAGVLHGFDGQKPDAAALVLRPVDEPDHVRVGSRGPRSGEEAARTPDSVRCHPSGHGLV